MYIMHQTYCTLIYFLIKNLQNNDSQYSKKDKRFRGFLKGIGPKVNVIIAWPGFELFYYDIAVWLVSHDATGTSPTREPLSLFIVSLSR